MPNKKTVWALNAGMLAAFAAIAVFSRPWAAFVGFLVLGALIGVLRAAARIRCGRLGGGAAAAALLAPPVWAGMAGAAVFFLMFVLGEYWKPLAVLLCGYTVYVSLLLPWRKGGP